MAFAEEQIKELRKSIGKNGYQQVRVRTLGKAPLAPGWQHGENSSALLAVTPDAANTGMLCRGLRVIDIDVDDQSTATKIVAKVAQLLPCGALLRRRNNSVRLAFVFKAAQGTPAKTAISGTFGKIEILGDGQQLLIYGTHPSGAELFWRNDRGPGDVALRDLPEVTEEQIANFLTECLPVINPDVTCAGNLPKLAVPHPAAKAAYDELVSGIESASWFGDLTPERKSSLVTACLGAIDNRQNDPRAVWLNVLFAVADAEQQGCPNAKALALDWSRRGAGWTNEADFERAWGSTGPGRVTVGTLIYKACSAGLSIAEWTGGPPPLDQIADFAALIADSLRLSSLPVVPAKRRWLHGTDIVRGAVTMLAAPGGRGKSSFLISLALGCASGKELLGSTIFGGPLRVLYINAEDSGAELNLRFRAALQHHKFAAAPPNLFVAGVETLGLSLLKQDRTGPSLDERGWAKLKHVLDETKPDIVILDPLVALIGGTSLNDNTAASLLIGALVQIASERDIAFLVAHHVSKGRDGGTAEAAMGAATLMNRARVGLSIQPVTEADAFKFGVAPADISAVFRVTSTKQNLSAPGASERLFRICSVEMQNAEPPIYPYGDKVAVVERYFPGIKNSTFVQAELNIVVAAISREAFPPALKGPNSASKVVMAALQGHRGRQVFVAEADAMIEHLKNKGILIVANVRVPRKNRGGYDREGVTVAMCPPANDSQ